MHVPRKRWLRSLGPAFITASVVIGPGSIVTSSKVGATFGYSMVWVLGVTVALMIAMTGLSARLGIALEGTPCEEVARRAGRPLAVAIGVAAFLITACFQSGNNVGILTALESLPGVTGLLSDDSSAAALWIVGGINAVLVVFLFSLKGVYRWIERLMMLLVAVMLVAFFTNLVFVVGHKLVASPSEAAERAAEPIETERLAPLPLVEQTAAGKRIVDPLGPLVALVGTTFSVAGAFFQAYLVRQKGWGPAEMRNGLVDTIAGISVLNLITLVIMLTSATVLRGADIQSAGDIAQQLAPLYGATATTLFSLGLLAAALSSLLVNAAIGGALLSDGLGLGGYFDQLGTKLFTIAGLATGFTVAVAARTAAGFNAVGLILFAQAATVIAWPLLAGVLIWLSRRPEIPPALRAPRWMTALCWCGLATSLVLAPRTAYWVYLRLSTM